MDKLIITLMPTDIWTVVFNYSIKDLYFENNAFPKYKYIFNTFAKNIDYINNKHVFELNNFEDMMAKIGSSSNVGMMKYLYDLNKLTKDHIHRYLMFGHACANGHLNILKKIISRHGLDNKYITAGYYYALRYTCENGHLEILKYLTKTFELTNYDINFNNNQLFRIASENEAYIHILHKFFSSRTFGLACVGAYQQNHAFGV